MSSPSRLKRTHLDDEIHLSNIACLPDACLSRIFALLNPMPDRFNAERVCKRWQSLASDRRTWLRVEPQYPLPPSYPSSSSFSTLELAVQAARPGDTILISPGHTHEVASVIIDKPLCIMGSGKTEEDTILNCPRGHDGALIFHSNARLVNLTVQSELGNCLLHRSGRLVVEKCALEVISHPLEHLVCPIVSTAPAYGSVPRIEPNLLGRPPSVQPAARRAMDGSLLPCLSSTNTRGVHRNVVCVEETRIEGGEKAVKMSGDLSLQQVRVMYARAALFFWFSVAHHPVNDGGINNSSVA